MKNIRKTAFVFTCATLALAAPAFSQKNAVDDPKSAATEGHSKENPGPGTETDAEAESPIVGEWVLSAINGVETPEGQPSTVFQFKADGTAIRKRGDTEKTGIYSLSDNRKSLLLGSKGAERKEVMEVVTLNETTLEFKDGDEKITLTRLPAGEEAVEARVLDGDIVGRWLVLSMEGKAVGEGDPAMVFELTETGTITQKRGDRIKSGTYTLSEDRALLTTVREGSDEEDLLEVIRLTDTELHLKERDASIVMRRLAPGEEPAVPSAPEGETGGNEVEVKPEASDSTEVK